MKYKLNKQIELITTIAANVKTLYITQNYDNTLSNNDLLHNLGIIPEEYWVEENHEYTTVFGGNFNLTGWENEFMIMMYDALPEKLCVDFYAYDWKSAGVSMVEIDDSQTFYLSADKKKISDITKMCKYNTSGDGTIGEVQLYFSDKTDAENEEWLKESQEILDNL